VPRDIARLIQHIKRMGWGYFIDNVRTHRL
jgi:hypothetical protein